MKNPKRIFAWIAIVILVGLSICTLIFALTNQQELFRTFLLATIFIPILIYVFYLIYRFINKSDSDVPSGKK